VREAPLSAGRKARKAARGVVVAPLDIRPPLVLLRPDSMVAMLSFEKRVEIQNPRLTAAYYFLLAATVLAILSKLAYNREYAAQVQMGSYIRQTMWTVKPSRAKLEALWEEKQKEPLCANPERFDYWWDVEDQWKFENHSCLGLCPAGQARIDCISDMELDLLEGQAQVFILTQMQETNLQPTAESIDTGKTKNFFLPYTEAMGVGLTYSYDMPELRSKLMWDNRISRSAASNENIFTVILDSNGKVWRELKPSTSVKLTIPEIFFLSGEPNILDEHQPSAGPNAKPGAQHVDGPIARLTGLEVVIDIECRRLLFWRSESDWDGPVCHMTVRRGRQLWSSAEQYDTFAMNGGTRHRLYHGVRVRCRSHGVVEFIDFNSIFLNLVSIIVLMRIPKTIILVFACTFLGHVSKIYKDVIVEKFNLADEIGGITTRLMASGVSFVGLTDGAGKGISVHRVRERLRAALKHRRGTLDEDEVDHLVAFCFNSVKRHHSLTEGPLSKSFLFEVMGRDEEPESEDLKAINVDDYNVACCSSERICLEDIVVLFDRHRSIKYLERVFMPRVIKRHIFDVQRAITPGRLQEDVGHLRSIQVEDPVVDPAFGTVLVNSLNSKPIREMHKKLIEKLSRSTSQASLLDAGWDSSLPVKPRLVAEVTRSTSQPSVLDARGGSSPPALPVKSKSFHHGVAYADEIQTPPSDPACIMSFGPEGDLTVEQEKVLSKWTRGTVRKLVQQGASVEQRLQQYVCMVEKMEKRFEDLQAELDAQLEAKHSEIVSAEKDGRDAELTTLQWHLRHELHSVRQEGSAALKKFRDVEKKRIDGALEALFQTVDSLKKENRQLMQIVHRSGMVSPGSPSSVAGKSDVPRHKSDAESPQGAGPLSYFASPLTILRG